MRLPHLPGPAARQYLTAIGLLATLALTPASEGSMLVLSIGTSSQGKLADVAIRHGGALLGPGPVARSLIIRGRRADLVPALLRVGALALAAPPTTCGGPPSAGRGGSA